MTDLKKNVPELRFPEFEGEWEEKKIKQLFKVVSGSTPLRSNSNYYDNGNVPWVKTTDLNNAIITQTSEKITEEAVQKLKLKVLPKNTLLIAMYGGFNQIGRTGLLQIEAATNQAISALLEMGDTNSKFFQAYLNFNVKKWHRVAASSRKDPNITKKDIENFKILNTSIKEQNKIGDFFVKLDRQIELEEQKLALLEEQKKGYMQKIFSQELRFKDDNGNDYPEWEEKRFLDLFKVIPSKDKQINSRDVLENGRFPVVDQGKKLFLGYSNEKSKVIENFENLIIYGDHTTIIKRINEPFIIGGDGVKLLTGIDEKPINYLFVLLQYFNFC
ncbi:restriction endonuclease subunit S [Staphylococcus delphini]|nr:restriction endonuclease subunit S [Staphylococcus delphini]MTV20604.1 restriction endonuclease subunit S [Staphylococcus delphini]